MTEKELTCRSCRWSIWNGVELVLWCELLACEAKSRCKGFEREPGADDDLEEAQ